jgi:hypothetical protein
VLMGSDLCMKAETRPDDGVLYWAFIMIYADDIYDWVMQ